MDKARTNGHAVKPENVLGSPLQPCSFKPNTGFYRDGHCHTGKEDRGLHVVCARMTDDFLVYSRKMGNNLSDPIPEYNFPGLKAGDFWCLCAVRWRQAYEDGMAPDVLLESTHHRTLEIISIEKLKEHKINTG